MTDENNEIRVTNTPPEIIKYYERFYSTDVPRKERFRLKNELMYQLFLTPKKDTKFESPTTLNNTDKTPNKIHQMDLLFMPFDTSHLPENTSEATKKKEAYKYGLTIVDTGSRTTECIPLKEKTSEAVLQAAKKLYSLKSSKLKQPQLIQVDDGSEFKGAFSNYFKKQGVDIRVAQVGRSRQQALVESRNGSIARALIRQMVLKEIQFGVINRDWVENLKVLIPLLNQQFYRKPIEVNDKDIVADVRAKPKTELLEVNTKVRVQLDKPVDILGNRQNGSFRQGDIRWSLKPTTIERLQLIPNQPPLYKLKGYKALYTRNQIQVVDVSNIPPEDKELFNIEQILDKRKNTNRIEYLVKWENFVTPEWTQRTALIATPAGKKFVNDFEKLLR